MQLKTQVIKFPQEIHQQNKKSVAVLRAHGHWGRGCHMPRESPQLAIGEPA